MNDATGRSSRFRSAEQPGFRHYDLREFSALVDRSYGSDTLVVAFANAPVPRHSDNRDSYWGSGFLAGRKLDHLSICARVHSWYRSDIIVNFLTEIGREKTYSRVLTYGVSKGGSGALWHAKAVGASEVLAFVPQVTYGPQVLARGDDRWHSASYHDWPEDELAASLSDVERVTVLTDTRNAFERAHLDDLRRIWDGPIRVIDMRYAGHDCVGMLGRQHGISKLFDMAVSAQFAAGQLRPITELRKAEPGYYRNLLASKRVSGSAWMRNLLARKASENNVDPAQVRMDSAYRKLSRLGRY